MSLQTNRTTNEAGARVPVAGQARKAPPAPVFKPEFARSVRMHPRVAIVVAAVVFVLLVAYALLQKPVYEAESLVRIEPNQAGLLSDNSAGLFDSSKYDSLLQQQVQTAQRLDVLAAAVHSLPAGTWREPGESEQNAATRLQNALKVQRVLSSFQLSFTLRGPNAQHTADTLNAVVAALLQAGRKDQLSEADQRTQILSEEKARIQSELSTERAEQASLSTRLGMADPGFENGNPYDSQLSGLRTELAAARESHDVAAAQLAAVSGPDAIRTGGLRAAADEAISGDAGLSSMKATISQRRAVLSGQMAGLTPENPIYKQDLIEIADLDRSLEAASTQMRDRAARRLQDKLRSDLARTGDVEARLNAQLAAQTFAATSASPKLQRASEVNADIARLMKRYADVDDALRALALESSGPGTIHLALAATAPLAPVPNRRHLLLLAAIPLALVCGLFGAVFARKRDTHLYTGRDLEDLLGFPPLAVLPAASDVSASMMKEYVLRLAGGIESAYRMSGAQTFVFTPASPATDIGDLMGALEDRLKDLGLSVTTIAAHDLLRSTAVPHGRELLPRPGNESAVATTLVRIKHEHDLVFIDAPALNYSAETEYMARCADATVLVVESCVSRRHELLQATVLLERLHVKGIAAVLVGLPLRFADAGMRTSVSTLRRRQHSTEATSVITDYRQEAAVGDLVQPAPIVEPIFAPRVYDETPEVASFVPVPEPSTEWATSNFEFEPEVETTPSLVSFSDDAMIEVAEPEDISEPGSVAHTHVAPETYEVVAEEETPAPEDSWLGKLLLNERGTTLDSHPATKEDDQTSVSTYVEPDATEEAELPVELHLDKVPAAIELDAFSAPVPMQEIGSSANVAEPVTDRESETAVDFSWTSAPATLLPSLQEDLEILPATASSAEQKSEHSSPPVELGISPSVSEEPEQHLVVEEVAELPYLAEKAVTVARVEDPEAAPLPGIPEPTPLKIAEAEYPTIEPSVAEAEVVPFRALRMISPLAPYSAPLQDPEARPLRPAPQRSQTSVSGMRVARLEPVLPPRAATSAWKDRRVSGSTPVYGAPERRFQWRDSMSTPQVALLPDTETGRREAGSPEPSDPPLDHTMTRRWALLSRFGEGDQPGATSPDGEQEDSSQSPLREYRQG